MASAISERHILVVTSVTTFEHQAQSEKIAGQHDRSATIFTESLILAQDERWRRA
jgi:hypothetical protein